MFPAYFDNRIVTDAQEWLAAGKPELTPIYIRNLVKVGYNTYTGDISFSAAHQNFMLVDGVESPIDEPSSNWVSDYAFCVNSAKWPELAELKDEKGLKVLAAVDPTLPGRTQRLIETNEEKIRSIRRDHAAREVFDHFKWPDTEEAKTEIKSTGSFDRSTIMVKGTKEGGIFYNESWHIMPARYEKPKAGESWGSVVRLGLGTAGGDDPLHVSEFSQTFSLPTGTRLPADMDQKFAERKAELEAAVEGAKSQAYAGPVHIQFPTAQPLEKGYPKASLPPTLTVRFGGWVKRTEAAVSNRYQRRQEMAFALGYIMVHQDQGGHRESRETEFALPGGVDPKKVCSYITRVDSARGILYAYKQDVGRVIGTGGATIKRIQQLTLRRWQVVGEEPPKPTVTPEQFCEELARRMMNGGSHDLPSALAEVVTHNYNLQSEMYKWNHRAGEKVFVTIREGWRDFQASLLQHLNGATSPETVANPAALRLPPLDQEKIELVKMLNPPAIPVLGTDRVVKYYNKDQQGSYMPAEVTLEGPDMEAPTFAWLQLPDEGVKLPSGRNLRVRIDVAGSQIAVGTEIPKLKADAIEHLNNRQWFDFYYHSSAEAAPTIVVLNPADQEATVSEVIMFQYGTCVVTGSPLCAYGTIQINPHYRLDDERDGELFTTLWTQSKAEAEKSNAQVKAKLAEVKLKREREEARIPAQAIQQEIREFVDQIPAGVGLGDLRNSIVSLTHDSLFGNAEELIEWTAKARRKLEQAKSALGQAQTEEPIVQAILERLPHRGTPEIARKAIAFGKDALRIAGSRQRAIEVITPEAGSPNHGFSRRKENISIGLPGVDKTSAGAFAFGGKLESSFMPVLRGALVWLEQQEEVAPKTTHKEENKPTESATVDALAALKQKWGAK